MAILVTDPALTRDLLARRRESGVDRFDEVWDGLRVLTPTRDDEHQRIVGGLLAALFLAVDQPGLGHLRTSINVSDRIEGWCRNYRCPDLAVRLKGGRARILKTHWYGGPDFVAEVLSPGDQSRKKLTFYAAIGTREVLLVGREPWALELLRLETGRLARVGVSRPGSPRAIASAVLPLSFRLTRGAPPKIEVRNLEDGVCWRI